MRPIGGNGGKNRMYSFKRKKGDHTPVIVSRDGKRIGWIVAVPGGFAYKSDDGLARSPVFGWPDEVQDFLETRGDEL